MSKPGSGRYTVYVPVSSTRNALLAKLFNDRAGSIAAIYGATYQKEQAKAAEEAVKTATAVVDAKGVGGLFPSDGKQVGDAQMFPTGVQFGFGGAPNLSDVKWDTATSASRTGTPSKAGGPANPYMPDPSSPGPGRTEGVQKDVNPEISVKDVKGSGYVPGGLDANTTSPSETSSTFGVGPIGKDLVPGRSSGRS